ncbi:MAG: hypothetical protein IKK33_16620 [Lachnospiraceae bacterium]|nr:hypothetical protein [Lachnospiraceae bacterium]
MKKTDKNVDVLEFKIINPKGIEDWADDCDIREVVEIYINGREIVELLKEIEMPWAIKEGEIDLAGTYGHLPPKELYSELNDTEESALLCCDGCGLVGCWSVFVNVEKDEKYVYWKDFRHNHREWKYNISYKFYRSEYEDMLKGVLEHQE